MLAQSRRSKGICWYRQGAIFKNSLDILHITGESAEFENVLCTTRAKQYVALELLLPSSRLWFPVIYMNSMIIVSQETQLTAQAWLKAKILTLDVSKRERTFGSMALNDHTTFTIINNASWP